MILNINNKKDKQCRNVVVLDGRFKIKPNGLHVFKAGGLAKIKILGIPSPLGAPRPTVKRGMSR